MSKVPKNTSGLTAIDKLANLKDDLLFLPSPVHRRAKSKFWARHDSLLGGPGTPSAAEVMEITGEPGIKKWWSVPGFKEWFLNKDEARERLEYLYMIALDSAESVLLDPDANANAKVQMVKVIAQLAGKEPEKTTKYVDEDIQKLTPEKLKEYIKKHAPKHLKVAGEPEDSE